MTYKWFDQNPVNQPANRHTAAMDYNPNTQRSVLFGGSTSFFGPTAFNDVWYWENGNWTQAFPTGTPPIARSTMSMIYDPINDEFLMFGGISNSSVHLNDTWALKGDLSAWTQKTPSTVPVARYGYQMAYHPATSSIYMWGGYNSNFFPGDRYETYRWTGSNWVLLTPANAPNSSFEFYVMFGTPVALEPNSGKLVWFAQHWKINPLSELLVQAYFDGTNFTAINSVSAVSFGVFAFGASYGMAVHNNLGRVIVAGGNAGSNYVPTQSLRPYPSTQWDRHDNSLAFSGTDPISNVQFPVMAPDKDGNVICYAVNNFLVAKTYVFKKVKVQAQIIRRS